MTETLHPKPRFVLLRSVFALILREMSTTYGRSPGGYIWALVEPVGAIAVMTAVFALVSRTPALGDNFPLYFAGGMLPFSMYQAVAANVGSALRYSKPLMAYPSVTYVDAILARLILTALTQLAISVMIILMIVLLFDQKLHFSFLLCVRGMAMMVALGCGVGLVNCYLMSMFPIWQSIWAVLNRPLFIISGIFFLVDPLPEEIRSALLYNPIAHGIMQMRNGLYDTYDAVYVSELYVYMLSLILASIGMLLLHRFHSEILDEGS